MKILTSDEMRQAELACARTGVTTDMLMQNAGRAVAEETGRILGSATHKSIVILIGSGNNGGDGLVAARHLHNNGARVSLFMPLQRESDDPNFKLVQERNIACHSDIEGLGEVLSTADAVIDAFFGTGSNRPIEGIFKQALERVAGAKKERWELAIIALDLPSGLNADSGGCDPSCLWADHTITLAFPKPGLYNSPGAGRAGVITIVDIGIAESMAADTRLELITDDWARSVLPKRPLGANKGSFGRALVVAGSINYVGAAYLACSGAIRVGAGLVTLAAAESLHPIMAAKLNEVTHLPLPESEKGAIAAEAVDVILTEAKCYQALLLGCGLGQNESTATFIRSVLLQPKYNLPPLVIDADAINTLAKTPGWWRQLPENAILTPHPAEMARLTGMPVSEIQADRVRTASYTASEWGKTVILKGAYTVIAAKDGRCRVSPAANPGLASAGSGDVLAGIIAGLLAQGPDLFDAASLGVWLHAGAGEAVREEMGDAGMIASDLLPVLPKVIKELKQVR